MAKLQLSNKNMSVVHGIFYILNGMNTMPRFPAAEATL